MFAALSGAHRAVQPASDADLSKGAEGCVPPALKAADGGEQSQHALLEQGLAVPSRQKQRAGAGAHQAAVAADQLLLSGGVPRPCQKALPTALDLKAMRLILLIPSSFRAFMQA